MIKASRLILLAAALLAAQPQVCCAQACTEAQSPSREVLADKMLSTTNHRRYPESTAAVAEAPEGYVPFHISTYARHGSRFLLKRDDYADALAPLCRAGQAGVLTPAGRRVKRCIEAVLAKADEGRYGELTAVGRSTAASPAVCMPASPRYLPTRPRSTPARQMCCGVSCR